MAENERKKTFQLNIFVFKSVIALSSSPFFSMNSGFGFSVISSYQPRCRLSSAHLPVVLKNIKITDRLSKPPINIGRKTNLQMFRKPRARCLASV